MKSLLLATGFAVLAIAATLSPVSAAQYGTPSASNGTPHWEWQYHYVGHHPRYEGGWVLVK